MHARSRAAGPPPGQQWGYDGLSEDVASEAKAAAATIRLINIEVEDRVVLIGRELIRVKKLLAQHGAWIPWLHAEFSWTPRYAQYMMRAARGHVRTKPLPTTDKRYWLTPPDKMAQIVAKFGELNDVCPHPRPSDYNGLTAEWEARNYCNPVFPEAHAFVMKAIAENQKGKFSLVVLPICAMGDIARLMTAGAVQFGDMEIPDWIAIEDGSINPAPPQTRQPCIWLALGRPFPEGGRLALGDAPSVREGSSGIADYDPALGPRYYWPPQPWRAFSGGIKKYPFSCDVKHSSLLSLPK